MPYIPQLHSTIGYIDKRYKEYLDELASKHSRSIKAELQILIEKAFIEEFGYEKHHAFKTAYFDRNNKVVDK